jgi:4-carboxymuconolactone decarboxylase
MPRLPSITHRDQVDARHHPVVDTILERRSAIQGPFTMLLHCPPFAGRLAPLGAYVRFDATLGKRVRVLAALTVAREFDVVYVWGAQAQEARKLGIPESTLAAIREKSYAGLPPEDAQIVDFTRELIRRHRVGASTMKALQERFGEFQLIELTGTIGYYSLLAMTANACEIDAPEGAEVLTQSPS